MTDNSRDFLRHWLTSHGIELLSAGELLVRLADQFPCQIRSAHAQTLRHSPKSEPEVVDTLERGAGLAAADAIRRATRD